MGLRLCRSLLQTSFAPATISHEPLSAFDPLFAISNQRICSPVRIHFRTRELGISTFKAYLTLIEFGLCAVIIAQ